MNVVVIIFVRVVHRFGNRFKRREMNDAGDVFFFFKNSIEAFFIADVDVVMADALARDRCDALVRICGSIGKIIDGNNVECRCVQQSDNGVRANISGAAGNDDRIV